MCDLNANMAQQDSQNSKIMRIRRDYYEQIVAERNAALREAASLRALIQADGTLSKAILGYGEFARAMAKGLGRLSQP